MPSLNTKLASAPNTTSNYVLKATSSTTIGNSLIFDNGTSTAIGGTTITDGNLLNIIGNQSSVNVGLVLNNTNGTYPKIYGIQNVNSNLVFYDYSASATRLTISSAGNVGIGTTPAAWAAPAAGKVLQIGTRSALFSYNNTSTDLSINIYFDGSDYRYIQSAAASLFRQNSSDGSILFYNASSGTAGAVTTLNERMRITSGGIIYALNSGVDGSYQPMIGGMYSSNNNETNLISTAVSSIGSQSGFRFDVSNGGGSTGRTAVFWITRSGFNSNVNGESVIVDNNPSNSGSRRVLTVQGGIFGSSGDASSKLIIFQANNGTEIGSVQRNGGANVVYNTSSDRRLKEDYKDFNGLDLVKNVKVYDFKWKGGEHRNYGVIADELQEVVPSIVSGTKDETYEDGRDKYMGVDYGQLTPILLKAIQELNAKVTQQQQQINQLINK